MFEGEEERGERRDAWLGYGCSEWKHEAECREPDVD